MTQKTLSTTGLCFLSLAAGINLIGGFLALTLRLPIYLDCIGTLMASVLLGPQYGMLTGLVSGIVSGITSDIYALYYIPVQLITALITGMVYRRWKMKGWMMVPVAAVIALPGTIVSSSITAMLFGGVTSSGSSVLVQLLYHSGLNMTMSVFVVQVFTDYADRLIGLMLMTAILRLIPMSLKEKLLKEKVKNTFKS